jgi:hypothetical protein
MWSGYVIGSFLSKNKATYGVKMWRSARAEILEFHVARPEDHLARPSSSPTFIFKYEGESNENRKTEIKIRNIAPLSYKLADMLPML